MGDSAQTPRSVRTKDFKKLFAALPDRVKETAVARYENYFRLDPYHPLLDRHNLYDVSDAAHDSIAFAMTYGYRAVAFFDQSTSTYVWYWCGSHTDYDRRFRAGR